MGTVDLPANVTSHRSILWPENTRRAFLVALLVWIVPMLVIGAMAIRDPLRHTVTTGSFHPAAHNWWARQNLYIGPAGMNYLPHFAILYTPFHLLPFTLSELVWRFCAAAIIALGVCRITRQLFGARFECPFLCASILTMPICLGALHNGNANGVFSGLTLLAVVAILQQRWWIALAWMALATACKPLGIVLLLLASIYYMPIARRLPLALLALAVFPFFFGPPDYVCAQYREAWLNLHACAAVTEHRFADINGILRTLGAPLPPASSTPMRFVAGALVAVVWLWGARRLEAAPRVLWLYALSTAFLMLFNPMTESNSYVILAPALGAWATFLLFKEERVSRRFGIAIAIMALCMGLLPAILHPFLGNRFALIWHPSTAILFLATLLAFIIRPRETSPQPLPAPAN
jgi:hypothetical protein